MPDPIRPEDHSLDGIQLADVVFEVEWESVSLFEAVHQTFERDASDLAAKEAYRVELAAYKSDPRPEPSDSPYKVGDGRETLLRPDPPHTTDDPDTEIDRRARLIVDGEYRRPRRNQRARMSGERFIVETGYFVTDDETGTTEGPFEWREAQNLRQKREAERASTKTETTLEGRDDEAI